MCWNDFALFSIQGIFQTSRNVEVKKIYFWLSNIPILKHKYVFFPNQINETLWILFW